MSGLERTREALRVGVTYGGACAGWPSGPDEKAEWEQDMAEFDAALAEIERFEAWRERAEAVIQAARAMADDHRESYSHVCACGICSAVRALDEDTA